MAVPHLLLLLLLVPAAVALLLLAALYVLCRPHPVKIPLKGRHVFITFASSGIGLAMARRAAAEGARVSILARDRAKLEAAREEIRRATGVEVAIYSADVRDREAVKKAVEAAGTIDVLICNQGVAVPKELVDQTMDEVMYQIDINLVAMITLVQAALPGMKKAAADDGLPRSITFTASPGGQVGYYAYSTYCATNFAVRGLAEALQMEVVNDNIRVSLLLPGDTDTPGRAEDWMWHKNQKNQTIFSKWMAVSDHSEPRGMEVLQQQHRSASVMEVSYDAISRQLRRRGLWYLTTEATHCDNERGFRMRWGVARERDLRGRERERERCSSANIGVGRERDELQQQHRRDEKKRKKMNSEKKEGGCQTEGINVVCNGEM